MYSRNVISITCNAGVTPAILAAQGVRQGSGKIKISFQPHFLLTPVQFCCFYFPVSPCHSLPYFIVQLPTQYDQLLAWYSLSICGAVHCGCWTVDHRAKVSEQVTRKCPIRSLGTRFYNFQPSIPTISPQIPTYSSWTRREWVSEWAVS